MNGNDVTPEGDAGSYSEAGKPTRTMPLKRGNACIRCRMRKMKCDANKDGCYNCTKSRQDCHYDSSIPSSKAGSKMKALEAKIAALEQKLSAGGINSAPPNSHPAFEGITYNAQASGSSGTKTYVHGWNPEAYMGSGAGFATTKATRPSQTDFSQPGTTQTTPFISHGAPGSAMYGEDQRFGTSTSYGYEGLAQTQNGAFVPADALSPQSQEILNDLLYQSEQPNNLAGDWGLGATLVQDTPVSNSNSSSNQASNTFFDSAVNIMAEGIGRLGTSTSPNEKSQEGYTSPPIPHVFSAGTQAFSTDNSPLGVGVLPDHAESQLVGGWHDSTDLPAGMRSKLLGHFFKKANKYFLGIDLPRFHTRLTMEPRKRPHPCWLYAMYLLGATFSGDPNLLSLRDHFFDVAKQQFEKAMTDSDRLLDAIRASNLLAGYLYSLAKYLQAYIMTGTCARLAISCGIHAISSTVLEEVMKDYPDGTGEMHGNSLGRPRVAKYWALPPPSDPTDLGERIAVFWGVFTNDRAGATAMKWPVAIPIESITTPFPHELWAYSNTSLSTESDQTVEDILNGRRNGSIIGDHLRLYTIRANVLMHEIARLTSVESTSVDMRSRGTENAIQDQFIPPGFLQDACPQVRHPLLYWQYKHALQAFVASFPPALQDPLQLHPFRQKINVDEVTLHLYVAIAELWLEDRDEEDADNVAALRVARKMVTLARAMPEEDLHEVDIYVCMLLIWAGRVLIKELKRLSLLVGDLLACASVEYDLDSLVYVIGRLGKDLKLAEMQVMRVTDWRMHAGGTADMFTHTAEQGVNPQLLR